MPLFWHKPTETEIVFAACLIAQEDMERYGPTRWAPNGKMTNDAVLNDVIPQAVARTFSSGGQIVMGTFECDRKQIDQARRYSEDAFVDWYIRSLRKEPVTKFIPDGIRDSQYRLYRSVALAGAVTPDQTPKVPLNKDTLFLVVGRFAGNRIPAGLEHVDKSRIHWDVEA